MENYVPQYFDDKLGFELCFSSFVLLLVLTTFLYVHVAYGDIVVTHMTTWPYRAAFTFIVVAIL